MRDSCTVYSVHVCAHTHTPHTHTHTHTHKHTHTYTSDLPSCHNDLSSAIELRSSRFIVFIKGDRCEGPQMAPHSSHIASKLNPHFPPPPLKKLQLYFITRPQSNCCGWAELHLRIVYSGQCTVHHSMKLPVSSHTLYIDFPPSSLLPLSVLLKVRMVARMSCTQSLFD